MAAKKDAIPSPEVVEKQLVTVQQDWTLPDAILINSVDGYEEAARWLKDIKAKQKELDERKKAVTRPHDEAKRALLALFREPEQRLANVESGIKAAMLRWNQKVEAARRAEEAKLREQQAKERAKLLERASKAEAQGNFDKANDLQERAETLPVPIVSPAPMTTPGIVQRKTWKAEVTDVDAFIRWCAEDPGRRGHYLNVDVTALNAFARSTRGTISVQGVRFFEESGLAARSA